MNFQIDAERLFNDLKYRTILLEYYNFVSYIVSEFNKWDHNHITSSSIKFHKDSPLYEFKDTLIEYLTNTFPKFDVLIEKYGECDELDENEFCVTISWKNYK